MGAYRPAASQFSADRDIVGVAAEGGYVALDPAERRLLVLKTEIAAAGERRKGEKAQGAQPVIDRHADYRVRANDPVLAVLDAAAGHIAAAVDIDIDRQLGVGAGSDRALDVHVQTILIDHEMSGIERLQLGTIAAVFLGRPHVAPVRGRLGRAPAQFTDRGRGVGNVEKVLDAERDLARDRSALRLHHQGGGGGRRGEESGADRRERAGGSETRCKRKFQRASHGSSFPVRGDPV